MKKTGKVLGFASVTRRRKDGSVILDAKAVLTGVVSKLYKNDANLLSLINSDTTTTEQLSSALLEADVARVAELTNGNTFQDGYKKAKKEERAAVEAELKTKYGIQKGDEGFDLEGQALLEFVVAKNTKSDKPGGDASKLTADQIKALPGYAAIDRDFKLQLQKVAEDADNKVKALNEEFEEKTTFGSLAEIALSELKSLNPVLATDPKVAKTRETKFLADLKSGEKKFRKNDDGTFTILDKDGNAAKDKHGNLIELSDYIKGVASEHYEFAANNGGDNSGNDNNDSKDKSVDPSSKAKGYPQGYVKPKNVDEYAKIVNDQTIDRAIRTQYSEAYHAENSATG